jgi:MFS transporter, FSR family, fosmidomycin resistance protein
LFPAFLLYSPIPTKITVIGLLGFFNSGWYSFLKGRLYSEISDQTPTVLVLDNAAALVGKLFSLALGIAAEHFGLKIAIWLLLTGPIALLIGLPRKTYQISVALLYLRIDIAIKKDIIYNK